MRIGIDCGALLPDYNGGVNTYVMGLISGFQIQNHKNHKFIIFCTYKNIHLFNKFTEDPLFEIITLNEYNYFIRKIFRIIPYLLNSSKLWKLSWNCYTNLFKINKKIENNCDILYTGTTALNIFNLKIPTILSMHDIQHFHYPEFFSKNQLKLLNFMFVNSAKNANYFQASSHFIKNDLLQNFKFLRSDQIIVIPEGVDINTFSKEPSINVKLKYNLPEKFLFYPAQLWKHKNHLSILKALKEIEVKQGIKIPLVLTGGKFSAYDDIIRYINTNEMNYVFYLGKVPFEDLLALYHEATFLVSASLHESSSLPILEAAAAGLPVIASNIEPNIEMAKVLNINLFNILNTAEIKEVIFRCWNNHESIHSQITNNRQYVNFYSWKQCAAKYIEFIEKIKINKDTSLKIESNLD